MYFQKSGRNSENLENFSKKPMVTLKTAWNVVTLKIKTENEEKLVEKK